MTSMTIHDTHSDDPESATLLERLESQVGFVPNIFTLVARSAPALAAFIELNQHFSASSLTATERELVQLVASAENGCGYCVAGHTTFARNQEIDEGLIDALRRGVPLSDWRLDALARFTRAVIQRRGHACEQELQDLTKAGYTHGQAIEVILGISVKTISNLTSSLFEIPVDEEFSSCAWAPVTAHSEVKAHVA